MEGKVDEVFLMGEDALIAPVRLFMLSPGIGPLNFRQAEAYSRCYNWLSML